jgi:hypothetical protein
VLRELVQRRGEVLHRAAQAIDAVDRDEIDGARTHVRHQALEARTRGVGAGEASIVVAIRHRLPALGGVPFDEGLDRRALRIAARELLLAAIHGLARVDGDACGHDAFRRSAATLGAS